MGKKHRAFCVVCGAEFTASTCAKTCSDACHAVLEKRWQKKAADDMRKFRFPKRKCHDCGAPTFDYRCPECWRKRREKYGGVDEEKPTPRDFDDEEFL